MSETISLHPSIDQGVKPGAANFAGGTLVCKCTQAPVKIAIKGQVAYDHACGCTECWKPAGAIMSVVAVVPRANLSVTENGDKLAIVDPSAAIQRYACKSCGVHVPGGSRTRNIRSMASTLSIPNCSRKPVGRRRSSPLSYRR